MQLAPNHTGEMLERRHCLCVFIIAGFATATFLIKLNLNLLFSLQKNSAPFDPDVFMVTLNSYSNVNPTKLSKRSSFNRRKIYPWKNDPSCQHLSVKVRSTRFILLLYSELCEYITRQNKNVEGDFHLLQASFNSLRYDKLKKKETT